MPDINKKTTFYENSFFGINSRLDTDKLPNGFSPLAVNMDLTKMKTLKTRKGTAIFGSPLEANKIQNVTQLTNPDGSKTQLMVKNGTIYKLNTNEGGRVWEIKNSGRLSSDVNTVQSIVFKNKIYFTTENDYLCSTIGDGVVTDVGTVDNRIKAKCIGSGQRTLFVGNVTVNNINYPDRVYYSLFDQDTLIETDQFWEEVEQGNPGTLATSSKFFRVEGGNVRAIVSFANRNRVYIFSDTKCYSLNVGGVQTNQFASLQEEFPVGCCGPNAAIVSNSMLYWMDQNCKMWSWNGITARPEEISYNLDSENGNASIINSISKSKENLESIAAFAFGKQLYFSVGEIRTADRILKNVVLKSFISQNGLMSYTSIDTFPDRIMLGTGITIEGSNILVVGTNAALLEMNVGLNDIQGAGGIVPVENIYQTKAYNFGFPLTTKKISNLFVQFLPTREDSYIDIAVCPDRGAYQKISEVNTINRFGVVGTKDLDEQKNQKIRKVNFPTESQGENIAFEFSNSSLDQGFEISAFGSTDVDVSPLNITMA
jgi:hypothetical protein